MSMFRSMAAVAVAGLVATACTGEIMMNRLHRPASDSFFQYAAGKGEMLAVVVNNPFPVSRELLDRAVTDAMRRNHHGPMTHFSTDPGPAAERNIRVVVAFNTAPMMLARTLCGDVAAVPVAGPAGDRLRTDVAFCVESDLYSHVDISIPTVQTPDDPRFRRMIASAMWALIPARDPLSSDDDDFCVGAGC